MNTRHLPGCVTALLLCTASLVHAQEGTQDVNEEKSAPEKSFSEVMSSPQVQSALQQAMQAINESERKDAADAESARAGIDSDAVRDATSVAAQAFGFAAANPDASESEKKAAAKRMMSGVFGRELENKTKDLPAAAPEVLEKAKDYGEYKEED